MTNPLAAQCPCGHPAYLHRTQEQIDANRADGRRYVGECTGKVGGGTTGACCECQAERSVVIAAATAKGRRMTTPAEVRTVAEEVFMPEGVEIWWEARHRAFDGATPRDAYAKDPRRVLDYLNALADGNFA